MFSSKLRSWMEAVRPRKKQQRKEKQQKSNVINNGTTIVTNFKPVKNSHSSENEILEDVDRKSMETIANHTPRYSGANLSSPESAYSTGYSTDGTSPGAPPEYYINIRTGTRYFPAGPIEEKCTTSYSNRILSHPKEGSPRSFTGSSSSRAKLSPRANISPRVDRLSTVAVHLNGDHNTLSMTQEYDVCKNGQSRTSVMLQSNGNEVSSRLTEVVVNSSITSPRQRNRIRTNPWVPGSNLSPGNSSAALYTRQESLKPPIINSPGPTRYLSPTVPCTPINRPTHCESLSSSSCSSLSAASLNWDTNLVHKSPRIQSGSDEEDDCTLNEMMGKYDESYVYEKETDILSDSDPTDCETDIDTGQDGGDEDDTHDREIDFIDNGSFLEFNAEMKTDRNTGHCTYFNFEQRKSFQSRRRPTRRSQKQDKNTNERRRRSNSSKKKHKIDLDKIHNVEGSKSAGATPLSVRRMKQHPLSKLATDNRLRKRSNSISFSRDPVSTFDRRDKEADRKYKELIVEAEHILMSMKSTIQSPRRIPGPANKRVEILRSTESSKPDAFIKNRLIEDISNIHLSRIPSNNYNSPRFSPKRNHITNFINNNSPILVRKDIERTVLLDTRGSPLLIRKEIAMKSVNSPPLLRNKKFSNNNNNHHSNKTNEKRSPKYRKKITKTSQKNNDSCSSDSENELKQNKNIIINSRMTNEFNCPQSEPVKRKIYSNESKAVAFNLNNDNLHSSDIHSSSLIVSDENKNTSGNTRQQILLHTIANLKKSLEDQSASLKQVYKSSQNIHT